jgi:hypothetical protein
VDVRARIHAGFLGEHALADGAPTLRMCSFVLPLAMRSLADATEESVAQLRGDGAGAEELAWERLEVLRGAVAKARASFAQQVDAHQTARVEVTGLGSDAIKKLGGCCCCRRRCSCCGCLGVRVRVCVCVYSNALAATRAIPALTCGAHH